MTLEELQKDADDKEVIVLILLTELNTLTSTRLEAEKQYYFTHAKYREEVNRYSQARQKYLEAKNSGVK